MVRQWSLQFEKDITLIKSNESVEKLLQYWDSNNYIKLLMAMENTMH
jgi:hypothetical protein